MPSALSGSRNYNLNHDISRTTGLKICTNVSVVFAVNDSRSVGHIAEASVSLHAFSTHSRSSAAPKFVTASAYGIGEVVAPVLDYLGCFYSAAEGKKEKGGEKSAVSPRQTREEEFLDMYRHLLDGQGAAPGP